MTGKRFSAQGSQDEDNLTAAWQWAQETMKASGFVIGIALLPTKRQGIWKVQARAMNQVDGKATGIAVQVASEYPTVAHRSFTAALMNCLMELDRELGQEALARRE